MQVLAGNLADSGMRAEGWPGRGWIASTTPFGMRQTPGIAFRKLNNEFAE